MTKYVRGLNREIVAAVNTGELTEPLTIVSVQALVHHRRWAVTDQFITLALVNAASETHSNAATPGAMMRWFRRRKDARTVELTNRRGSSPSASR